MNGVDRIDKINKMATVPEEHRANWKPQAERIAAEVETEIARLRTFAGQKPGFVADRSCSAADLLEAELQEAMAKFDKARLLFIVYQIGRFGPEKIMGYIITENAECLRETTHLTFDIIGKISDMENLAQQIAEYQLTSRAVRVTNPKSIGNLSEYRKWQRSQRV